MGKRGRWLANYVIDVLSVLFAWGVPRGLMASNPAMGIPSIRRPRKMARANRPWKATEFNIVAAHAGLGAATALDLGYFGLLRISDTIAVEWRQYDGRVLKLTIGKNGPRDRDRDYRAVAHAIGTRAP